MSEVKEFWEWCGFKWDDNYWGDCWCEYPDGTRVHFHPEADKDNEGYEPVLDLNNLFKWAVPKAVKVIQDAFICIQEAAMQHLFSEWLAIYWKPRQEPISIAEALYKAIQKIRRENES